MHVGIGMRGPHEREIIEFEPDVDWLEVHTENYFGEGGAPIDNLMLAGEAYPISLHGVGLSLGSCDPLSREHLKKLKHLVELVGPIFVSEHLSWASIDGVYFNDLLPLPYTEEALQHFCNRVAEVQEFLGRTILIENPSSYLQYRHSTIPEWEFLNDIHVRTGAKLLLDVNNVYVSACNQSFDPMEYLRCISAEAVSEIHLAGHTVKTVDGVELLIDDHASPVCAEVWALYETTLELTGPKPTIVEWDTALPPLVRLVLEADAARQRLETYCAVAS